jgi:hypothetical protein
MNPVGHYETLGVAPEASMQEIRQAYLRAARNAHPDLNNGSETQRQNAEDQMRSVNAAWAVLSDVDQRSAYDRQRLRPSTSKPQTSTGTGPVNDFVPFDDGEPDEFDERHDQPLSDSSLPRWLSATPLVAVVLGLGGVVMGGVLNLSVLLTIGVLILVVSAALMFVAAPLVTLARAVRGDRGNA